MKTKLKSLDEYYDTPPPTPPVEDIFDTPVEDISTTTRRVMNFFPSVPGRNGVKLAIIAASPGKDDWGTGIPFSGYVGRLIAQHLSQAGVLQNSVFKGFLDNAGAHLPSLNADLAVYEPNICVLLGQGALDAAIDGKKLDNFRGSLFVGTKGPFNGRKCLATYHPTDCFRLYYNMPSFEFDMAKAVRNARTPSLCLPERELITWENIPDPDQRCDAIVAALDDLYVRKPKVGTDIEGYVHAMTCISFADSPARAFIVPFTRADGGSLWTHDQEVRIWRALARVLTDPAIYKVLQNSLYDRFVLLYSYGIVVRGVVEDTMLKHWEKYCELEKNLGFLASVYTDEPYYKSERKDGDMLTYWRYCCKDSAVTLEISKRLDSLLAPGQKQHYMFNMLLLHPFLYMENRGLLYDSAKAATRRAEINRLIYELQFELDQLSGHGVKPPYNRVEMLDTLQSTMCMVRDRSTPKKEFVGIYYDLMAHLKDPDRPLDNAFIGWFNTECGLGLNIKGSKFKPYLYETLGLPKQYDRQTKALTTNYEALLTLFKKTGHKSVEIAMELTTLRTRAQMLEIHADDDGRIRCSYNLVGTETGRITCYKSPTGSGYNLQTIPDANYLKPEWHPLRSGMRDLVLADEDHWLFQCDLSGADGWTVAAYLAMLGDPTMLDDMRAGIKPAKVLCLNLRHGAGYTSGRSREEVKELCKEVSKDHWDYFACKIGQHGTCYLMGPKLLAASIFVQSEGKVNLTENETKDIQRLFTLRYRVKLWHDYTARQLSKNPEMVSASGHRRRFFGRRDEILSQALANEPQENTTYATNMAAYKLWTDPENSNSGSRLRIEPLHQVHDAIVGQFRKEDTAWAVNKIKSYFDNPMIIAGQRIVIPFEGNYGRSWGELTEGSIS
jgi:DNA polymerase I-like protein with 3'-5' exonuclease and polymerase domains/uracil-DNA glycosylase